MKRVGINAVVLTPRSGGLLTYLSNLIDHILALPSDIKFSLFFSREFLNDDSRYAELPQSIGLPLSGSQPKTRILKELLVWPRTLRQQPIDLFHSPISYIPLGVSGPAIVTIHDLGFFHYPAHYTRLRCKYLQKMIARAARKALKIIAISEYTKNDIIETLGIPAEKIECIYHGFDATPFRATHIEEQIARIRAKYQLPEQFILAVGHLEPRKNYLRLLQAFHQLREQQKIPHHLIIVGQENWLYKPFYELMHQLKLNNAVHFTGFVDQADLPAIYQLADVFILPTLFEGFGIPVLESMAAGTPVVCSNVASLPEIGQQAALYFNPYEVADMSEKIWQLINNEQVQQQFIQAGFENIKRFQWHECAQKTVNLYQAVLTN